jgi:membrane associated rhomboid family serine protease
MEHVRYFRGYYRKANLGASGAIAAAPDVFLVTYPRDRMQVVLVIGWFAHITFIPAALLIGLWFVIQLVSVGAVANVNTGGIAYVAHIAGMIFGAVAVRFFADPERRVEASHGAAC